MTEENKDQRQAGSTVVALAAVRGNADAAGLDVLRKLHAFASRFGQYQPKVGDVIRSLPDVYVGAVTTGQYCIVVAVYDYVDNPDYKVGHPTAMRRSNVDIATVDKEGDILTFQTDTKFFELIARKSE